MIFISMDGVYAENCLEQFQRISMDGVAENCSWHFPHFPHPCGSYAENCLEQFQRISMDGVAENCSSTTAPALSYYRPSMDICIFRTSHFHVGRLKIAPRQLLLRCPTTL